MNHNIQNSMQNTKRTARAVVLVAIGVALAPITSFPIGIAVVNPTQHFVNVVGAVLLGPWWACGIALVIGIIRNSMGLGTLLAFPGGMMGALLAGAAYRLFRRAGAAAAGEILGTGVLGAIAGGLLVAPVFMDSPLTVTALMPSFLGSSIAGAALALPALAVLRRAGFIDGR